MNLEILTQLFGLALVDAINPCEIAVMTMVLLALLLKDPTKRKKVLLGGLMFTLAVFIMYFLYGLIIVKFFQTFVLSGEVYLWIFRGFGLLAIILGLLNIKDYLYYKPGTIGTEMPLSFRPRAKQVINKITSPFGAFIVGILVSVFLLPCSMGPYLIFSGKIANIEISSVLLLLLIYNIIFIIPMILVTLLIYFGLTTVDKVSGWKERNIKRLHLAEGIILLILGILMITGILI